MSLKRKISEMSYIPDERQNLNLEKLPETPELLSSGMNGCPERSQ